MDLTGEQKKLINELYRAEGRCLCGTNLMNGDRALLGQPGSDESKEYPGRFVIRAFCGSCFAVLQATFKKIKENKSIPA